VPSEGGWAGDPPHIDADDRMSQGVSPRCRRIASDGSRGAGTGTLRDAPPAGRAELTG
jgi:hypothetical protein